MNPEGGGCSELRSRHCTSDWGTEPDSILKEKKKDNLTPTSFLYKQAERDDRGVFCQLEHNGMSSNIGDYYKQ